MALPALLALCVAGCRAAEVSPTALVPTVAAPVATVPQPEATVTATEIPLAARVNGQPITQDAFQREIARYEAALAELGRDPAAEGDYRRVVLDELINRQLVMQAAARLSVAVADADLEASYANSVAAAGGQAAFDAWLAANLYTPEEFRAELQAALTAQALAAAVAEVPATAEQVHARHILVADENNAQTVLALLQGGSDFADLAGRYSRDLSTRLNGGDLGWFYRGALAVPEVEDAAFNLQPNAISGIIQSGLGFHLVQTLEHDPVRPLAATRVAALRQQAFDQWLAAERAGAAVEIIGQ